MSVVKFMGSVVTAPSADAGRDITVVDGFAITEGTGTSHLLHTEGRSDITINQAGFDEFVQKASAIARGDYVVIGG